MIQPFDYGDYANSNLLLQRRLSLIGIEDPRELIDRAEKRGWVKRPASPKTSWQRLINRDLATHLTTTLHVVD